MDGDLGCAVEGETVVDEEEEEGEEGVRGGGGGARGRGSPMEKIMKESSTKKVRAHRAVRTRGRSGSTSGAAVGLAGDASKRCEVGEDG